MKPKPISCTCEIMHGTGKIVNMSGEIELPIMTECDRATDYILIHANGTIRAACTEHASLFSEYAGLVVRLAVTEIEKGRGRWV